jgi:hypothetical protein
MTIPGLHLRRTVALPAAAVLLATGIICLYAVPGVWVPRWVDLAAVQRNYELLLVPLALAGGAWQALRERRARLTDLHGSVPLPPWRRSLPVLAATGGTTVIAYALAFVAAAARMLPTAGYFAPEVPLMVAVGALSLVAAVWIGYGLGRLLPHVLTAAGLAVVALVLGFTYNGVLLPALNRPREDFVTMSGAFLGAQTLWFAGLAVAGAVLGAAPGRWRSLALLPAGAGLLGALIVAPAEDRTYVPDPAASTPVCTSDLPRVCVSAEDRRRLREATPLARQALSIMKDVPGAPVEARQQVRDPRVLGFGLAVGADGHLYPERDFLESALRGGGVPLCGTTGDAIARVMPARIAVAAWLLGRPVPDDPFVEDPGEVREMVAGLDALPRAEALRRVAAVREAGLHCRQDLDAVLRGEGTR